MAYPGTQNLLNAFTLIRDAIARKQDKLTGTAGQVVGFDANGKPTAQSAGGLSGLTGILPIQKGGTGNADGYIRTGLKAGETAGNYATAEGYLNIANGQAAHAEGQQTSANGQGDHAEGCSTETNGLGAHAEGWQAGAHGQGAHAEGYGARAGNLAAHAEGFFTNANEQASHAEGYCTNADNFASHAAGKRNKPMAGGGADDNIVGDAMVIGNGINDSSGATVPYSNCFRVTYAGEVYGLSAFQSTGADYAEYFEWADGNPDSEDRVGYFVTLEGNKIRIAQPGDYVLGIVSGQPCIIGNADEDWLGRWEHDAFGRFVREDVYTPVMGQRPVLDDSGNPTGKFVEFNTGEFKHGWRFKANPDYDPAQAYVERRDRPEWSAVGMLGVLSVRDGGSCGVNGYCAVGPDGSAAAAEKYVPGQSWRVIRRVTGDVVQVVFR